MFAKQSLPGTERLLSTQMLAALGLTLAYPGMMLVLFLYASKVVYEPIFLLPVMNTLFAGALPILAALFALRAYLRVGPNSLLLMASGLISFGCAAILAGWLIGGAQGPNVNVTIYNIGALSGAVLHALGVLSSLRNTLAEINRRRKISRLIWFCSGIFIFLAAVTWAVLQGITPVFFVQGSGPTLLRQVVLGSSAILYFLSALFLIVLFRREQKPFYYWYALSLIMLSLGLVAALIQASVGSPMGWLNRAGHYVAGIYAMVAILATSHYAKKIGLPFQVEMSELFRQAQISYEVLVETVIEAIITTDEDFNIIQWNSAAEKKFGYSQNEAFGVSLLELLISPCSAGIFRDKAKQIVKTWLDQSSVGSPIQITGRSKNADNLPLEVSLSAMRVKGRLLFVSVVRDNSKRKEEEDALRQQSAEALKARERLYRSVLSSMSEGIVSHARDGAIEWANPSAERILGLSAAQMRGLTPIDPNWQAIHEDGSPFPGATHPASVVLRTGVPQSNIIMGIRHRNGALRWISINAMPVFGDDDLVFSSVVASFLDVTEHKSIAAELNHHHQHLEQLVLSRTEELAQAKTGAEAANIAKSAFLATMSHELRTPLNAVIGLAGLLADAPTGRRQRDYADKIQSSAVSLGTLIDDILDFSKIDAGQLQLELAEFSLNTLLSSVAAITGVGLGSKPIEVLFDVAADVPDALIGDATRLQQILLNLTGNAVKFTETGTIVLNVGSLAQDAAQVSLQFSVRDSGIGIAGEQLNAIFERFTQAEASTRRLYGGSGLGLAICDRLIKLMGGRISVSSTLGQGSEFRFSVSLALSDAAQVMPESQLGVLSVLIIDDHDLARQLFARTCTDLGWQVCALDSAVAGLKELERSAAAEQDYDLMLVDWHMPGMDGIAMLRRAYANPAIRLPLVLLMAPILELEQAVAASDDLHLDGLAAKPMTSVDLLSAVTRAYAGECTGMLSLRAKTDRRLAHMRLLVAEDNELNQEVIEQILSRAGAELVLVGNGLAAVQALQAPAAHFDAVLMDIQMPVMDGYAATKIIREELGMRDLPIIAVTAFARPEDRERSRLAGMVGHIVKPIDVEDLLDLVASKRAPAPAAPNQTAHRVAQHSAALLPGLDVATALQHFGGDQKKYRELLVKFMLKHGGDVREARRLFELDDIKAARALLHDLHGVASILRATDLARVAMAAEGALLDGAPSAILSRLFDEMLELMLTLEASVAQL